MFLPLLPPLFSSAGNDGSVTVAATAALFAHLIPSPRGQAALLSHLQVCYPPHTGSPGVVGSGFCHRVASHLQPVERTDHASNAVVSFQSLFVTAA